MASSKMVNDRQRSAATVAEAANTHSVRVGARLQEVLGALARPGESAVEWPLVLGLLGRALSHSAVALVAADEAHEAEKADDPETREARDVAAELLLRELSDLKVAVESVYGSGAARTLGFSGPIPREPIALARQAAMAVASLSKLEDLEPVRRGMRVDVGTYRQPIESAIADLARASAAVQREARELEATQVAKDAAMSAHDARFMAVARCLEGLYRLAGEAELADRVRPSLRRPGRTASDAAAEPEAEPEPTPASDTAN